MDSSRKEGTENLELAKKMIGEGNHKAAVNLLRKAITKFDIAIVTAKLNSATNFVSSYESKRREARDLMTQILGHDYSENKNSHFPFIDEIKDVKNIRDKARESREIKERKNEVIIDPEKGKEVISEANPEEPDEEVMKDDYEIHEKKPVPKFVLEKSENVGAGELKINKQTKGFSEVKSDISIRLGIDEDKKEVVWRPKLQANQHLVAVGMSGTGKTTAVRTILYQLRNQNVPLIIFDLHDDFSADRIINFGEITINPLELDGLTPKEKAIEFAYICKRIFKLGDQQENKLREAIVHCYQLAGIDVLDKNTWDKKVPTLADVNDYLENNRDGKTIDTLLGRVKFFHRVELFMSETRCPFYEMFSGSTVIKLIEFSDNPDLQTALCEIFLNKLLFTVKKSGQSKLRAYCVIDEAHILDDGRDSYRSPLVKIAREARKYGLGLILASQMPKDFSKSVLHNTATIMSLKFNAVEEARAVSQQMYGVTEEDILNLGEIGEGFIKLGSEVKKVNFYTVKDL